MSDDPLLCAADVARHLGVSPATVYGWVHRRQLPAPDQERTVTIYQRRWWLRSTIDRWWASWPYNPANRPAAAVSRRRTLSDWEDLA